MNRFQSVVPKLIFLILFAVSQAACQSKSALAPAEFEQKLSLPGAQVVDVRTAEEFKKGRIAKAVNYNINDPAFSSQLRQLDKGKPVLVYCLSGGRSAKAADMLRKYGFGEVYELRGGLLKWNDQGRPVEKAASAASGMTPEEFQKAVSAHDLVLVDVWAKWCGPCKKMAPELEALKAKYSGKMVLLKIDADQNSELIDGLKVDALPTLFIYHKGEKKWSAVGYRSGAAIEDELARFL